MLTCINMQYYIRFILISSLICYLTSSATILLAQRPPAPYLPEPAIDLSDIPYDELVATLDDDDYSLRLQAELLLVKIPPEDLITLCANLHEFNLESQIRLAKLEKHAKLLLFQKKTQRFILGNNTESDAEIPGWQEFIKLFPEGAKYRRPYAEMITNEFDLFSQWEEDETRETILLTRCYEISSGLDSGVQYLPKSASTMHSLLFLSSRPDVKGNATIGSYLYSIVSIYASRNNLNSITTKTADTRTVSQEFELMLLNYWIVHAEIVPQTSRFSLGNRYNLRGTLNLSRKMISSIVDGSQLHDPICCLARLGDESTIPELVALLKDDRYAGPRYSTNSKDKPFGLQVRDIALACLVSKTKQSFSEYGFHNLRENSMTLFSKYSTNFSDESARTLAFKKWEAWAKDNINEKNELIKSKEVSPPISPSINTK